MLITQKVIVKIHPSNMKYYNNLGYNDIGVGDEIEVNVDNLKRGSHITIKCKCDGCGIEKEIGYRNYLKYIKNDGNYLCRKCSQKKLEETNFKKYGKKYPSQRIEILDKMKKTMIINYGVENASQSMEIQNKKIETNNKKFGCDWGLSNGEIKEKSKKTCLNKYGVEYISQHDSIKNKIIETNIKKWGVDNYTKTEMYKEKSKKTCMDKYGVEHQSQSKSSKEKRKQTFIRKYGVENVLQNEEIYKKMIRSSFIIKYYNNTPLYYQGTYEKDFLDKYFGKFVIMNGKTISYEMNGKKKKYYSDFYLPDYNLIVEIKSTRWYIKHLDKNIIKEKTCKELGYNYIFIIDKNYDFFEQIIKNNN